MKLKYLILFFVLLFPYLSYGEGGVKALGEFLDFLDSIPKKVIYLTGLSLICLIWFLYYRNRKAKVTTIIISIPLILLSVSIVPVVSTSELAYLLLILNLTLVIIALWCKSYPKYEILLGKISPDNRIITWVKIQKISFGQWVELSYHQAFFKDGIMVVSSAELLEEREKYENLKFESFDEAFDYLKETHKLNQLKFIENRNFFKDLKESSIV